MDKTSRIHSFDALRAIMMLLGLVIHSAITYNETVHGNDWPLKDPNSTHLFSDFLVFLIHFFRMPIFFLVAGFFGAMLYYERGPIKMIKNRVSRILFPFLVFLVILFPVVVFVFKYTLAIFSNIKQPLSLAVAEFSDIQNILPSSTFHLWFLYYLILITTITFFLALIIKHFRGLRTSIYTVYDFVIQRPFLRVLVLTELISIILVSSGKSMIKVSTSLIPDLTTLIFFLVFYLLGWCLYKLKKHIYTFREYDRISIGLAFLLVIIEGLIIQKYNLHPDNDMIILSICNSLIIVLFLFGITGFFIRYTSKYSLKMRYLSDASYWVYLIHLPLTVIFPAFFWELSLSTFGKFLIVLLLTILICFISYHYLVRNTFIGKFLNGRKYSNRL